MGHRKSVNVPGVRINLPSLTEKDKTNIKYAIERDIDFIAHSFVRTKQDVLDIKEILDAYGSDIKIIAKIENQEGVDNIDEILEVADGVMVARGDLGIEVPQERIPGIQRILIKTVIVATQMLHTMIKNPRPTRAEVTDIANAIYYRTDAIMLSGETAYGKYPVEAVQTMAKVAKQAEIDKLPDNDIKIPLTENTDVTAFLAKQAVKATNVMPIKAIITDSFSGTTARNLAVVSTQYSPSVTRRRQCVTLLSLTEWKLSTCQRRQTVRLTTLQPSRSSWTTECSRAQIWLHTSVVVRREQRHHSSKSTP